MLLLAEKAEGRALFGSFYASKFRSKIFGSIFGGNNTLLVIGLYIMASIK